MVVHLADLSSPSKNWDISREWSNRINEEFMEVNKAEVKNNIDYMGEFLRRIRISGRKCLKNASRYRKLGKTNLRQIEKKHVLTCFSYFSFF